MTSKGLSSKEARIRLEKFGENELRGKKEKSPLLIFLLQFKDVMILILAAAALLSVIIGETTEAVTIIAVMTVNAFMGFIQELRTERTIKALSRLSAPTARAVRDGETTSIKASQLVPEDLIILKAGDRVPADCEALETSGMCADEAMLSGESLPVEKKKGSPLYMGTMIASGHGSAVVKSTGMRTEMGAIADMLGEEGGGDTHLQKRLRSLGRAVAASCLVVCAAVAAIGLLRGEAPMDMLLTALSLSVAAIPEGLPAIVTVVLALSVNRMLQKGAVIRKLHAVETLGCATVICSDKTGTVTQNRMSVEEIYADGRSHLRSKKGGFSEKSSELVLSALRCAVLCSEGNGEIKKGKAGEDCGPTESALFEAAYEFGMTKKKLLSECEVLSENPFDSSRKMMSTHIAKNEKTLLLA